MFNSVITYLFLYFAQIVDINYMLVSALDEINSNLPKEVLPLVLKFYYYF